MKLIENLAALMERSGDNPHSLARKVKARYGTSPSQPTLARILDGTSREPRRSSLQPVADYYGVSVDTLFDEDLTRKGEGAPAETPSTAVSLSIPVTNAWGSMGLGAPQPEHEVIVSGVTVSMDWVRNSLPRISHPSKLSVLTAFGRSMEPTLEDGDTMLVDRGISEIREDGIFVIALDDELYIKRVQRRLPDKAIIIKSDNPHYEPMVVENGDRSKLEILGRVVWVWKGVKL